MAATVAVVLSTNLDDVTPEVLGHTIDRLLAAGADDAWVVPIVMKKSRPAFELCALTTPASAPVLRAIISAETGTLGIRETAATKHAQPRDGSTRSRSMAAPCASRSARTAPSPSTTISSHSARATGRPLRELAAEALARHHDR